MNEHVNCNMGEHACSDPSQCFEPCGALGHDEAHATPAPVQHMTEEHANAILRVIAEDKRLPQLDENNVLKATTQQAQVIAERVWWKTSLYSPTGLAQLFPGLRKHKRPSGRRR